jgi:trypsin-like peptidase/effector-associated domain 8 (EAD8)-containing protein
MNPNAFIAQEDVHLLVQTLTTLALEINAADSRKDLLINAGINVDWRSKLIFTESAYLFANKLVAHFREFCVSEEQPTYHPMVKLLEYLLQTYALEEQDKHLLTRLVKQGQDNFGGLMARRTIGRIESPPGTAFATGVLIGKQLLLTCEHVFERIRESGQDRAWVRFGYKMGKYGVEIGRVFELEMTNLVSHKSEPDYALVRVIGMLNGPIAPVFTGLPSAMQDVRLIHHPGGTPAQISEIGQIVSADKGYLQHTIQTEYGSSGGGIFDLRWCLIAIHRGPLFILLSRLAPQKACLFTASGTTSSPISLTRPIE